MELQGKINVEVMMKSCSVLAAIMLAAAGSSQIIAQSVGTCAVPPAIPLKTSSLLTIDGRQASFEVIGSEQDGVRISCKLSHQEDAGKIKVSFSEANGAASLQFKGGPKNNVSIRIEVPRNTDLTLRARAGEWTVKNVTGNKNIQLTFGDISVSPVTREEYGLVEGSARIGDVNVPGKGVKKEDFFQSFVTNANPGKYRLEAHVVTGDVTFSAPQVTQISTPDEAREKTYSRSEVTAIIAADRKIVTPNGVEELVPVQINGTKQWLSIRGKDKRNPILLFLHGGPGLPFMPSDWTVQTPWEDYFTVVQWDQRGAGKTFGSNDPKTIAPTMSIDQMTDDAVQVVSYLRTTFGKQKIVLVGHSWGTVLGIGVAQKHPDWLYAYVGVGQFVDSMRNEADGYEFALAEAKSRGNVAAIKELEAIAPYPGDAGTISFEKIGTERKWVGSFGGLAYGRADLDFDDALATLSPDYTAKDVDDVGAGAGFSASQLIGPLFKLNMATVTTFQCPVFLFEGRHDYATSHALAAEWFTKVKAPQKELVWFDDSAHMVMLEEPGRFLNHLVHDVRPIAEIAGDVAPNETVVR